MKLFLALLLSLIANAALAQNTTCPTRPPGDISNACASTAFVTAQAGGGISPIAFGAKCNGVADDTIPLQAWLATLNASNIGIIPPGNCVFTSPLSAAANNIAIVGQGRYNSVLVYNGLNTTVDLITIGDGTNQYRGIFFDNWRITAGTVMTAGTAIRLRRVVRSSIHEFIVDGQDGTGNLWNGIWFDQVDNVDFTHFEARGQNDAIRVHGVNGQPQADLFLSDCKITKSGVGIHMGGGFGGLSVVQCDIINNARNVLIDVALQATNNREAFFGSGVSIDTTLTVGAFPASFGIEINDTLSTILSVAKFEGVWLASATSHCMQIDTGVNMTVLFNGGRLYNCGVGAGTVDGIRNNSTGVTLKVDGTQISSNTGWGVNNTVSNTTTWVVNPIFSSNGSGNTTGVAALFVPNASGSYTIAGGGLIVGTNGGVGGSMQLNGATSGLGNINVTATGGTTQIQSGQTSNVTTLNVVDTVSGGFVGSQIQNISAANNSAARTQWTTGVANAFGLTQLVNGVANPTWDFTFGTGVVGGIRILNNATVAATWLNGLQVGAAPTGGDKGAGTINAQSGFFANGNAGLSVTKTVRAAGGAADCTLIFTAGLLTGGSC